jgi:CMP-2-keto-3-deoxyoctulosonic acid synthetase
MGAAPRRTGLHIGVYGYDRATLAGYARARSRPNSKPSNPSNSFRFLAHGLTFQTVVTDYHPVAIDTPEDRRSRASPLGVKTRRS